MSLEQYKFDNTALGVGIFSLPLSILELIFGFAWAPTRSNLINFISRVEDFGTFYFLIGSHLFVSVTFLCIGFYIKWLNS